MGSEGVPRICLLTIGVDDFEVCKKKFVLDDGDIKEAAKDFVCAHSSIKMDHLDDCQFRLLRNDDDFGEVDIRVSEICDKDKIRAWFNSNVNLVSSSRMQSEADSFAESITGPSAALNTSMVPPSNQSMASSTEGSRASASGTPQGYRINTKLVKFQFTDEGYDVKAILSKSDKGGRINDDLTRIIDKVSKLDNASSMEAKKSFGTLRDERRRLTKHLSLWLMENCEMRNRPTVLEKARLAYSIIRAFPYFDYKPTDDALGYELWYDPVSHLGFIHDCIKNQRHNNPLIETNSYRKRARGNQQENIGDDFEHEINEIRRMRPIGEEAKLRINDVMEKTRESRQSWIRTENPTATDIFTKYPRLRDMQGHLILLEFDYVVKDIPRCAAHLICYYWETITPFVLRHVIGSKVSDHQRSILRPFNALDKDDLSQLNQDIQSLLALLMLPFIIPPASQGRSKGGEKRDNSPINALEQLIRFERVGIPLAEIISGHKAINLQPYLLVLTVSGQVGDPVEIFVILDYEPIQVSGNITTAIQLLFCAFFAFNIMYPAPLEPMYQFLEGQFGVQTKSDRTKKRKNSTALEFGHFIDKQVDNYKSPTF